MTEHCESIAVNGRMVLKQGIVVCLLLTATAVLAQNEQWGAVSYVPPPGWQKQQNAAAVQYSITGNDRSYALVIVTKATQSTAPADVNFTNQWQALIKSTVPGITAPVMTPPSTDHGWEIRSGTAPVVGNGANGSATLLTASTNLQTISVVLLSNTQKYARQMKDFVDSLKMAQANQPAQTPPSVAGNKARGTPEASGLTDRIWEGSTSEKFTVGALNGHYTGGFFKWQYRFNADGTYRFVYVGASAYTDTNQVQHETGTWVMKGNQLTLSPQTGANEEWSVVGGPVKPSSMSAAEIRRIKEQWGTRQQTAKRKLETVTYTFRIEYQQGNQANALILGYGGGRTEREGSGTTAWYFETPAGKSVTLPQGM